MLYPHKELAFSHEKEFEVLITVTTWMSPKNIKLGERRQSQNVTECMNAIT